MSFVSATLVRVCDYCGCIQPTPERVPPPGWKWAHTLPNIYGTNHRCADCLLHQDKCWADLWASNLPTDRGNCQ